MELKIKSANLQTALEKIAELDRRKWDAVLKGMDFWPQSDGRVRVHLEGSTAEPVYMTVSEVANEHLGGKLGIPQNYLAKCLKEAPALWAQNVRHWLSQDAGRKLSHPIQCVTNYGKHLGLDKNETDKLLEYFMKGGAVDTAFDMAQAATFYAQHSAGSADRRYEIECEVVNVLAVIERMDKPQRATVVDARNN